MINMSIDVNYIDYWGNLTNVVQRQKEYDGEILLHPMDVLKKRKEICLKRNKVGIYTNIDIVNKEVSKEELENIFIDSISNEEYNAVISNGGLEKVLSQLKASPYISFSKACVQAQINC